jgi:hypothetical protein
MKYYLVYQITNIIDGKIYIGAHKTNDLFDGYLGSGKYLRRAIKKHGIENFKRDVIHFCNSEEDMFAKEKEIVTEEFIKRKDTYNCKVGGEGGWDFANKLAENTQINWKSRAGKQGALAFKKKYENDKKFAEEMFKIRSNVAKTNYKTGKWKPLDWTGRHHNDETKLKMSKSAKGKRCGKNNPQYGMCWIHDDKRSIKIKKEELSHYLINGWKKGRIQGKCQALRKLYSNKENHPSYGKIGIHNDIMNKRVANNKVNEYLNNGWKLGFLKK